MYYVLLTGLSLHANRELGGRVAASAVSIQFDSLGAGIDQVPFITTMNLIEMAAANNLVFDYVERNTGREGEINVCVHFHQPLNRYHFVKTLEPVIAATGTATFLSVQFDCRGRPLPKDHN